MFLGGLFYCKTPMGANKIFYCAVSRVERKKKKKSRPLTISPSQRGLWFACFLARKSSISAENFKSPTWLPARYEQPDRASPFCGFAAGRSRALGNLLNATRTESHRLIPRTQHHPSRCSRLEAPAQGRA